MRTEKKGSSVFRALLVTLLFAASAALAGGARKEAGPRNWQELKERTLAAKDVDSETRSRLMTLFTDAEAERNRLAGKHYSSTNEQDLASCKRLEALLAELQKESDVEVVVCVLSETSGGDFVRQAAYRCLLQNSDRYNIADTEMLVKVLILTHKGEMIGWHKGVQGGWLADDEMRRRVAILLGSVLRLTKEQMPEGVGLSDPYGSTAVKHTKTWLKKVLRAALSVPANADEKVITRALADLEK